MTQRWVCPSKQSHDLPHDLSHDLFVFDSEEDSGSNTLRELCYETPPTGTPSSSTHSPMHGTSVFTGVHLQQGCGSIAVKREGGERVRTKANEVSIGKKDVFI